MAFDVNDDPNRVAMRLFEMFAEAGADGTPDDTDNDTYDGYYATDDDFDRRE